MTSRNGGKFSGILIRKYVSLPQGEFTDEGTETHFLIFEKEAFIRAVSSGKKRDGIIHSLFFRDNEVPLAVE